MTTRETRSSSATTLKISTTGFEAKTNKAFELFINNLGGEYTSNMGFDINVLICDKIDSEKYRVQSLFIY